MYRVRWLLYLKQLRFVMASARIPTSRIHMPDDIEHFVEVAAAS